MARFRRRNANRSRIVRGRRLMTRGGRQSAYSRAFNRAYEQGFAAGYAQGVHRGL